MTFRYRYRKQILIGIVIFLILGSTITSIYFLLSEKEKEKKGKMIIAKNIQKASNNKSLLKKEVKKEINSIMIDIKGEVVNPGIYELDDKSRVIDAINKAGGTTENADTSVLNLSKRIKDEMVIIVYSYYEVKNFKAIKEEEKRVQKECVKGINDIENDACIDEKTSNPNSKTNQKVSLNNATAEELLSLSGLGEAKAKAIIEYREKNGPFQEIEDLLKVKGIGESLLAKIKENITL